MILINIWLQPDTRYIDSNYTDETFNHLKIKAIILANPQGEVVYKRGFDFSTGQPWSIPKLLEQAISKGGMFLDPTKTHLSGLFWTPEGVCLVTAMDIQPSASKSIRRGTLIMVRHIDSALIEHIEKVVGAKLSIQQLKKGENSRVRKRL